MGTAGGDPIWIKERDVSALLDLPDAIDTVRAALRGDENGASWTMEKTHASWGDGHTLHALGGGIPSNATVGVKAWAHTGGGANPLLALWDSNEGGLRAVIEAFALGQLRTAAISGVATDALASPRAEVAALLGTGKQALPQLAAIAAVRSPRLVRVWSRDPDQRRSFAERVRALDLAAEVEVAESIAEATAGAAVITTATRAREPFLDLTDVAPGSHVNAIGAITPERRELTDALVAECDPVVADSPDAARRLSPELACAGPVSALSDLLAAPSPRAPEAISLFKAMGIGVADVALGAAVLARAEQAGVGLSIPRPERTAPRLTRTGPPGGGS